MFDMGYINFYGIDCVYAENKGIFCILPKNKAEQKRLFDCFEMPQLVLEYSSLIYKNCCAFIKEGRRHIDQGIELKAEYIIAKANNFPIQTLEITGNDIDVFFSPARYFYEQFHKNRADIGNVVYEGKLADNWNIVFEGKEIEISLFYDAILSKGIASDLKLHPKLKVSFPATTDGQFLYRIYSFIIKFLQIIQYRQTHCDYTVTLHGGTKEQDNINVGKLIDIYSSQKTDEKEYGEINYNNYKPYIGKLLQFAANNPNISLKHLPHDRMRFSAKDYTAMDFLSIYFAFESECHANKSIYEKVDDAPISRIKEEVLKGIKKCICFNKHESDFLKNVEDRISQTGTQLGQKRRIVNAYNVLSSAFTHSIKNIFYKYKLENDNMLSEKEIRQFAEKLTNWRGAIAHGGFCGEFTEADVQIIKFLEILTYCQILKRAEIEDEDIEKIIGAVWFCNTLFFEEFLR